MAHIVYADNELYLVVIQLSYFRCGNPFLYFVLGCLAVITWTTVSGYILLMHGATYGLSYQW